MKRKEIKNLFKLISSDDPKNKLIALQMIDFENYNQADLINKFYEKIPLFPYIGLKVLLNTFYLPITGQETFHLVTPRIVPSTSGASPTFEYQFFQEEFHAPLLVYSPVQMNKIRTRPISLLKDVESAKLGFYQNRYNKLFL